MARIRIQGKAGRTVAAAAADRAVPSASRLADVVCGNVDPLAAPVVRGARRKTTVRRPGDACAAALEPLPRRAAPVDPRDVLRVPLHQRRGAPHDRTVVDAAGNRTLSATVPIACRTGEIAARRPGRRRSPE